MALPRDAMPGRVRGRGQEAGARLLEEESVHDRRPGVRGEELEELDVGRKDALLLLEGGKDHDRAEGLAHAGRLGAGIGGDLQVERHDHGRPVGVAARRVDRRIELDLAAQEDAADVRVFHSDAPCAVGQVTFVGDREEVRTIFGGEVDGEAAGPEELTEQLAEVAQDAADAAGRVELAGRDVEARQVRELRLDLGVLVVEFALKLVDLLRLREKELLFGLERLDLLEQIADGLVAGQRRAEARVLALLLGLCGPEPLVLAEQLVRELRALPEKLLDEGVSLALQVVDRAVGSDAVCGLHRCVSGVLARRIAHAVGCER